ncbi:MAG: hypothetical protein IJ421_04320 [Prevotella sp.]|nr:hypothetical protein [Prevotella sp.]
MMDIIFYDVETGTGDKLTRSLTPNPSLKGNKASPPTPLLGEGASMLSEVDEYL